MPDAELSSRRVLVLEDEYAPAEELSEALAGDGATVVLPIGGRRRHRREPARRVDLSREELLAERGVPFVFATGYDASIFPVQFRGVVRCEKPLDLQVTAVVSRVIEAKALGVEKSAT